MLSLICTNFVLRRSFTTPFVISYQKRCLVSISFGKVEQGQRLERLVRVPSSSKAAFLELAQPIQEQEALDRCQKMIIYPGEVRDFGEMDYRPTTLWLAHMS